MDDLFSTRTLVPYVVVGDRDEDEELVEAVAGFGRDMIERAGYTMDELPTAVRHMMPLDYYAGQVRNGGHHQYLNNLAQNRGGFGPPCQAELAAVHAALAAVKADTYLDIFERYLAITQSIVTERVGTGAPVDQAWNITRDARLNGLDDEFFALDMQLELQCADWLRATTPMRIVSVAEARSIYATLADANPLRAARLARRAADLEAERAADPLWSSARKLCAAINAEHQQFTAGIFVADGIIWGMKTSNGLMKMWLAKDVAALVDPQSSIRSGCHPDPHQVIARIDLVDGRPAGDVRLAGR